MLLLLHRTNPFESVYISFNKVLLLLLLLLKIPIFSETNNLESAHNCWTVCFVKKYFFFSYSLLNYP